MYNLGKLLWLSAILLFMAMPAYSFAEGVTVHCSILSSESVGEMLNGTMRTEVTNLTGSPVRNVDLRLENSVPNYKDIPCQ